MTAKTKAVSELNKALATAKQELKRSQDEVKAIEQAIKSLGGKARGGRAGSSGRKSGRQAEVLAYIKKHPETSNKEISAGLGMNQSAVSQIITRLTKENAITKDGRKLTAV